MDSRSNIPLEQTRSFSDKFLTAAFMIIKFSKVMKGHLVLLSGQLDSGTLGSVPVTKTFFAGNKPRSNNNNNYTYYIDEHGI